MRKPKRFSFWWALLWSLLLGVGVICYLFWHWAKRDDLIYLRLVDGQLTVTVERQPGTAVVGASILGLALVFGVLIGLLVIFGGGGSKLTLSEYFQQLEPIISGIDDRSGAQVVGEPADAFALWALVLDFTAQDLRDIDPPALVARDHRDLAAAFAEGAQRMVAMSDLYPVVETLEDADRLINEDAEIKAADTRGVQACQALLAIADDNGFDIRLEYC